MDLEHWMRWWKTEGEGQLRALLLKHWDPITVLDEPNAQDEYDSYLGPLANRLRRSATPAAVAEYLAGVESTMGFSTTPEQLTGVSERIVAWYASATEGWSGVSEVPIGGAAAADRSGLEYVGSEFVKFTDNSFRWVDLKFFQVPAGVAPEAALTMLLVHARYRDHYASPDSAETTTADIHGPYVLSRITPHSFQAVDEAVALGTVTEFANNYSTNDDTESRLRETVYPVIHAAAHRFRLKDLGNENWHDWGWVLTEFDELVLVDESRHRLTLLVAGQD